MENLIEAKPVEAVTGESVISTLADSGAGSSDDEVQEVQEELEVLKADTVYHDFLLDVVLNR
jgi:hypothetical protein